MIFDPHAGSATLLATSSDTGTTILPDFAEIERIREEIARERDMRKLGFGQRESLCG